jgi:hypothetical protein
MQSINLEPNRMLFLDDNFIERCVGAKRTFYSFEKESGNPIITKKYDWEGIGPYRASTEVHPDGGYFMWYATFGGKKGDYPTGYMRSQDCINWVRHPVWLDSIDDGAAACGAQYDLGHHFGEYKYIGIAFYRYEDGIPDPHVRFKRSKDGMHWEYFDGNPFWVGPSDVYFPMWDPLRKKYVLYYKLWKFAGETLDGKRFKCYFPGFDTEIKKNTFRGYGLSVLPERRYVDVTLKYSGGSNNDGGGGVVNTSVTMVRVLARAESADFVHWDNEQIIVEPPDDAPLGDQSYGMSVRFYNGLYLGFLNHFNGMNGHIRPVLAWSYDGIHFNINYDHYLIDCGDKGQWDAGMVLCGNMMDGVGDRLCLYYGGTDHDHSRPDSELTGGIGRAWIRKEGFASLTGGVIITKPIMISKNRLSLNMRGQAGVELIDVDGTVLAKARAAGDHARIMPDIDLKPFMGRSLSLSVRFDLSEGELYSLGLSSL